MANTSDSDSHGQPSAFRRAWSEHPEVIIGALIAAAAALMVPLMGLLEHEKDPDAAAESSSPTSVYSESPSPPPTAKPDYSTDPPQESDPPNPAPAKPHWKGVVTLPLSLNQNSDVGAELDGERPGQLVGVDDDLRGDYSTSAAIMVMSGHAAEASGDVDSLDRSICEKRITTEVRNNPQWIYISRGDSVGGTYCLATTEGHLAAFTIISAEQLPLPVSVSVKVVIWD